MIIEVKIPSPGESITEVEIGNWFVSSGDVVSKDQEIGEIESEKATLPLIADKGGKVELLAEAGDTVNVGDVVCKIDASAEGDSDTTEDGGSEDSTSEEKSERKSKSAESSPAKTEKEEKGAEKDEVAAKKESAEESDDHETPGKQEKQADKRTDSKAQEGPEADSAEDTRVKSTPVARKMMEDAGLDVDDIINGLRKITSGDVRNVIESGAMKDQAPGKPQQASREEDRTKMSQLRRKISERLVAVKNETAMLTTFNEADMSQVMNLRKKYQDRFVEKHGIKLGFMSFFARAVTQALKQYPNVNAYLDGEEIVTPKYCDIGIAVQTDKGLMVPVLRNTETLSLAEIEHQIMDLAGRARKNRISMDEMSGGTFTITNGGIFGSMLSTPILNPPQSAILGMHNIVDRPVAIGGKVDIRPMMYIALSYDHRIIDGRDSVGFLKTVKEYIENPVSLLFEGQPPEDILLEL